MRSTARAGCQGVRASGRSHRHPRGRLLGSIAKIPDVPACALHAGARGVPALLAEVRMRSLPPPVARVRSFASFVAVLLLTTLAAAAQAATLPAGFTETRV